MAIEISVVIPIYRCENCLEELHSRLTSVLCSLVSNYEIIFVDDRSPDFSWNCLKKIAFQDKRVRAFRLSRNFGQHSAITAGLAESCGDHVVVMDGDLEDPPEVIPRLYAEAGKGFDVVLSRRHLRHHSFVRVIGSMLYYYLLRVFGKVEMAGEYGNLSILSRKVVRAFLLVPDRDRQYLLILYWLGFRSTSIEYMQEERGTRISSYSFSSLLGQVLAGIFFQTTIFLRWIIYLGFSVTLVGVLLALLYTVRYFVFDVPAGWTSLIVVNLLIGGFIITSSGVAALYIARIFEQVKGRPLYVIDETIEGHVDEHRAWELRSDERLTSKEESSS